MVTIQITNNHRGIAHHNTLSLPSSQRIFKTRRVGSKTSWTAPVTCSLSRRVDRGHLPCSYLGGPSPKRKSSHRSRARKDTQRVTLLGRTAQELLSQPSSERLSSGQVAALQRYFADEPASADQIATLLTELTSSSKPPSATLSAILKWAEESGLPVEEKHYRRVISSLGPARCEDAVALLECLQQSKIIIPTVRIYHQVINTCTRAKRWQSALELYNQMPERGLKPLTATCNAVLRVLLKAGRVTSVLQVFDDCRTAGVEPDEQTYATAVLACCRAQRAERAQHLAAAMPLRCVYAALLRGLNQYAPQDWRRCEAVVRQMRAAGVELDLDMANAVLTVYATAGRCHLAQRTVDDMVARGVAPNIATMNCLLTASKDDEAAAFKVMAEIRKLGLTPDVFTYTNLIIACRRTDDALLALEDMKAKGVQPVLGTYHALMYKLAAGRRPRQSDLRVAGLLLREMERAGIRADLRIYTSALLACKKCKDWHGAHGLYRKMQRRGIRVNTAMFNMLIRTARAEGEMEAALRLLDDMQHRGVPADVITYNTLIGGCEGYPQAYSVFRRMQEDGVDPDIITYTALISACEREGNFTSALDIFQEMKLAGIAPDVIVYNAVISACSKGRDDNSAMQLFEEMQRSGLKPDVITYRCVIAALNSRGRNEESVLLLDEMMRAVNEGRMKQA